MAVVGVLGTVAAAVWSNCDPRRYLEQSLRIVAALPEESVARQELLAQTERQVLHSVRGIKNRRAWRQVWWGFGQIVWGVFVALYTALRSADIATAVQVFGFVGAGLSVLGGVALLAWFGPKRERDAGGRRVTEARGSAAGSTRTEGRASGRATGG